jgi:hypothetical protein
VDNVKMALGEIGWEGTDWIDLAQYGDPWKVLVILNSCIAGGFSKRTQLRGLC